MHIRFNLVLIKVKNLSIRAVRGKNVGLVENVQKFKDKTFDYTDQTPNKARSRSAYLLSVVTSSLLAKSPITRSTPLVDCEAIGGDSSEGGREDGAT
jgi:hypothetical protein